MTDTQVLGIAAAALAIGLVLSRVVEALVRKITASTRGDQQDTLQVELTQATAAIQELRGDIGEVKRALAEITAITKVVAVHDWRLTDIDKRLGALERRAFDQGEG